MRRAAARLQCANNLKQIAIGLHSYADTYRPAENRGEPARLLPAGTVPVTGLAPEKRLSWFVEILPFVEQESVYRRFDRTAGHEAPANRAAGQTQLRMLLCPDWVRETTPDPLLLTAYIGVAGLGADAPTLSAGDPRAGVFGYDRRTALPAAIPDGTSNTLLVLESARDNGHWAQGGPATVRGLDRCERPYLGVGRPFGGTHFSENTLFGRGKSNGCSAAMADGSVRFLAEATAPNVLEALVTVAGGEGIGDGW